jgi:ornithine cyclodeaminase/alanine dehydrogenase-like protein (mu-crystallin family)
MSPNKVSGSQNIPVLSDADILPLLDMRQLVPVMEEFLRARTRGSVVAPPRNSVAFEPHGNLVFTIGGIDVPGQMPLAGFRVYDTFKSDGRSTQIVAVWNSDNGDLLGLILGDALGAWRAGALGGVAVKYLSRSDATTCAVIGTGRQAKTQLLGAAACRSLTDVRVYGRDKQRRQDFAEELSPLIGLDVAVASCARDAIADADIVLCATNSGVPVIETRWLSAGAHINTVGPKLMSAHELPRDIGESVELIVTDSEEQIISYGDPYFLDGTKAWENLQSLGDVVSNKLPFPRSRHALSLYCSVGLAGTEVAAAAHVLSRFQERRT